jgi:UDPglucose 6-dehydrogenase
VAKIAVIGAGYVGLTTGACFAHLGHEVVCADIDIRKVERLRSGDVPFVEAGLAELVREGIAANRLTFVLEAEKAAKSCEFAFLCVPTPEGEDGQADLSYVETAASQISAVLPRDAVVINKSTVPVGSTRVVERVLCRPDVYVVSNPEFLREGSAVDDFLHPDRIIVGSDDREAANRVGRLYESIKAPVLFTDAASAEMIKYAANAFLATKLSFANAIANICEGVSADVRDVMRGIGYDRRIGHEFLKPGPGWGGSCIPKDTMALLKIAEKAGYVFHLLQGVVDANQEQFELTTGKVLSLLPTNGRVAAWGLTFKALTDDRRDSPSIEVISRLLDRGVYVRAFDPTVDSTLRELPFLELGHSELGVCEEADVLVVLTEWESFRLVDPEEVGRLMRNRNVVDARNLLDRAAWKSAGFKYLGIGR